MLAVLYHLPVSPWSLKARCALRLCEVAVRERAYVPLLGEPALRLRMGRFSGRVTVPVLFTSEGVYSDSLDIARYAESHGKPQGLFPPEHDAAIAAYNASSERLLAAGRICSMLRVVSEPTAALETLPRARAAVAAFNAKYGITPGAEVEATRRARTELLALREALSDGREYLLGSFTYADITMALALQLIQPLPGSPMGPSSLRAATHPELTAEFADLLAWRDRIHARHGLLPIP